MVLIMEWLKKIASIIGKRFPSPCGDYGSYLIIINDFKFFPLCFRPLAGIMVLIWRWQKGVYYENN